MTQQDLEKKVQRLEDAYETQNLMGKYSYYCTLSMWDKVAGLFAQKTPGVTAEIADGGVWEGLEGIKRLWPGIHAHNLEGRPGNLVQHDLTTPVVEVAGDGKTAKGLWNSPGVLTGKKATGELRSVWIWVKYGIDFVKEDDAWKIWHLHVYLTFRTPFDEGWAKTPVVGSFNPTADFKPDRDSTYYRPFHPDRINVLRPAPPEPYETWDGVSMT